MSIKRAVFDLEGDGLYHDTTKLWLNTVKNLETGEVKTWKYTDDYSPTELLEDVEEYIGHNIIGHDFPVLEKLYEWKPKADRRITDTLVISRTLNPDRPRPYNYNGKGGPHSLEAYGYRVGRGKPDYNDWETFTPEMVTRNVEDVHINESALRLLENEIGDWDWSEAFRIEHEFATILEKQSRTGIFFDKKKAEECILDLEERIYKIDQEILPKLPSELVKLYSVPIKEPFLKTGEYNKRTRDYIDEAYRAYWKDDIIGGPFNRIRFETFDLNSTTKIKDYLLANGWEPEFWNYSKTSGERTSPKLEGEFKGISGELPKRVKERITWRHREGQIKGWLGRIREDGRLSAGGNPCGTNTGRVKHSNVANITKANTYSKKHLNKGIITDESLIGTLIWETSHQKDIYGTQMRSLFIPREGYKLVGHDASGLELRMLAHYLNDEEFTRQILSGDIHEYNRKLAGLPDRDAAKTFIYALIYGAGDGKLGSIVGGTSEDGAELKRRFFDAIPKLEKLINSVKSASGRGFLKGLDGRKVWMRRNSFGKIDRKKALNTLLQSAGAIVMKQSCILLWARIEYLEYIDAIKVLDMHDEGQAEVREDQVDIFGELAVQSIVNAGEYFNLRIPLAAEYKVGDNMAETH